MLKRTLARVSRPLSRLLLRTVTLHDPWHRYPSEVPLARFGLGARHDFTWYLEGDTDVQVDSIPELIQWLAQCAYRRDTELFNEADYWQHPRTLEVLQQGDCEDFSLWSWRKLAEMGYRTEFVAGRSRCPHTNQHLPHTWVHVEIDDQSHVLDPVIRDHDLMLQPLHAVRPAYIPEVSVDHDLQRYVYAGYYLHLQDQA